MMLNRQRGFTLYELLITVLVIGVILSLGVPNFRAFTANSRISAAVNDLHSAFMLARTEAARAKEEVTICASADGASCNATDFDDGWIVFVDIDGNGAVDVGTDSVVRVFPAVNDSININATDTNDTPTTTFTFTANGLGTGAPESLSAATVCDDRGNRITEGGWSAARVLIVTPLGRSNVLRDLAQIENQGGCP